MRGSFKTAPADIARGFRLEWLSLCAVLALLAAVLSGALYRERLELDSKEQERLHVQARVVDETLARQLEGVSNALTNVARELTFDGSGAPWATLSGKLEAFVSAMPGVRTMALLDPRGIIVASSRSDQVGMEAQERAYLAVPRQRGNPATLLVSSPFKSPQGAYAVAVGRSLIGPAGEDMGLISATLDPDYFDVVLRSVLYAPDMRTTLIHGDGRIFLNAPLSPEALGVDLTAPDSLLSRHLAGGLEATLLVGRAFAGPEDRMVALRTISGDRLKTNKPLVVTVSRELSALYAPWYAKAGRFVAFYAVVCLAGGLGVYFSQNRRRVLARLAATAAKERQESAERLELALRGADLGLWDLQLQNGRLILNQRQRELLGYPESERLGMSAWNRLLHPDDAERVQAAFEPHLAGTTRTFDCEYRLRHKDGHYVWLSSRAMIVERDATGQPLRLVGTHLDISERVRIDSELRSAHADLRRSEDRLSLALEGSGLALFDWDIAGDLVYHSAHAATMRGEAPGEVSAPPAELLAYVHPDDLDPMRACAIDALTGRAEVYICEFRLRQRGGGWRWVRAHGRVVERDAAGRGLRLIGTYADVNERKLAEAALRHKAEFDHLTDLPNRASFIERLQQAMQRAAPDAQMAVLFLDVDHFKHINDTLGHAAGDQLLKVFARRMRDCVRHSDTVARLAGDEFTVILEGLRDTAAAKALAAKLVETLRAPLSLDGKVYRTTASIGLAMGHPGEQDGAALLRRADAALYEAKRRGRNGHFCDGDAPGLAEAPVQAPVQAAAPMLK